MIDFSIMDPVVADICKSLEGGIDEWEIETCTMRKKGTKNKYLIACGCEVRDTFNEGCSVTVFSKEQGARIRDSLYRHKDMMVLKRQRELLQALNAGPGQSEDRPTKKRRKWYEQFLSN